MDFLSQVTTFQLIANILSGIFALYVYNKLPLIQLKLDKQVQHLVFGSSAALFILWMFRTSIYDGLSVHFLWLATIPLLLGFRWSLFSASLVLLSLTALGEESFRMLGVNFLLGVLLPISVTYALYSVTFYKLPRNLISYIFVCGFIAGGLSIGLKMFAMGGYYYLEGIHTWHVVSENYLVLLKYLLMPEAMFNTMTLVILALHKPKWVYTFYNKFDVNKGK
ncbi:energy-coupling factor ABC transporter permease [Paraglaciecola aquimarina]|uniref:Energy-coupling factor ABC transporter permease n=1 Tax=Paraglaciecola algarum TaxID=3050085 RepID=A0ABS9DBD6_9ALTE|nr:energy-coupling factor ABC transporter permease [Paraglaciecola sp. G1-23]MCF2948956.1 energy-coupling factor ABC transporter permease [Paraglaciecola sp. G1-23]